MVEETLNIYEVSEFGIHFRLHIVIAQDEEQALKFVFGEKLKPENYPNSQILKLGIFTGQEHGIGPGVRLCKRKMREEEDDYNC